MQTDPADAAAEALQATLRAASLPLLAEELARRLAVAARGDAPADVRATLADAAELLGGVVGRSPDDDVVEATAMLLHNVLRGFPTTPPAPSDHVQGVALDLGATPAAQCGQVAALRAVAIVVTTMVGFLDAPAPHHPWYVVWNRVDAALRAAGVAAHDALALADRLVAAGVRKF